MHKYDMIQSADVTSYKKLDFQYTEVPVCGPHTLAVPSNIIQCV